jgi:hypothetical protein
MKKWKTPEIIGEFLLHELEQNLLTGDWGKWSQHIWNQA